MTPPLQWYVMRFWDKVKVMGPEECWPWMGSTSSGYGMLGIGKRSWGAHRISYQLVVGRIPRKWEIDHLCRNKICVNPAHLEAVRKGENIRRGWVGRRPTQCPQGHAYTAENTRYYKGFANCRKCSAIKNLAKYHARKNA